MDFVVLGFRTVSNYSGLVAYWVTETRFILSGLFEIFLW